MFFSKFPLTEYDFYGAGQNSKIPDIFRQVRVIDNRFDSAAPYRLYEIGEERPDQLSFNLYGTVDYYWTFFVVNDRLRGGLPEWPLSDIQLKQNIDREYPYYAITAYRNADQDLNYNSIHNKFAVGDRIIGVLSDATAIIKKRNDQVNQIVFEYETTNKFRTDEQIITESGSAIQPNFDLTLEKDAVRYYVDADNEKTSNFENIRKPSFSVSNREHEEITNTEKRFIRVLRSEFVDDFSVLFRKLINV